MNSELSTMVIDDMEAVINNKFKMNKKNQENKIKLPSKHIVK